MNWGGVIDLKEDCESPEDFAKRMRKLNTEMRDRRIRFSGNNIDVGGVVEHNSMDVELKKRHY